MKIFRSFLLLSLVLVATPVLAQLTQEMRFELAPSQEAGAKKGDFSLYVLNSSGKKLLQTFPADQAKMSAPKFHQQTLGLSLQAGSNGETTLIREPDLSSTSTQRQGELLGRFKTPEGTPSVAPGTRIRIAIGRGNGLLGEEGDLWVTQLAPAGGINVLHLGRDSEKSLSFGFSQKNEKSPIQIGNSEKYIQFPKDSRNIGVDIPSNEQLLGAPVANPAEAASAAIQQTKSQTIRSGRKNVGSPQGNSARSAR